MFDAQYLPIQSWPFNHVLLKGLKGQSWEFLNKAFKALKLESFHGILRLQDYDRNLSGPLFII